MLQHKSDICMKVSPSNSKTDSGIASSSVQEVRDLLEEDIVEKSLTHQGLPKDQIDSSGLSDLKNIKKTIVLLRNQLLQEEGNKLIPGGKVEQISLRLHAVEAGLEGLIDKKVKGSASQISDDDFSSQKASYIVELEKKIHCYEEKLRQAAKREEELKDEVQKLTTVISSLNTPNFSNKQIEKLSSLETLKQVQVMRERLAPVQKTMSVVGQKPTQGLEYIRKCTPEEQNLIAGQYLNIQEQLKEKGENILIYYTFRNDKLNESCGIQEIHKWVKKLIEEIEPGAGCYPVVQCFILNPKENQLSQDYHMDYIEHMRTLFVSMDYLTTLNSTQFFKEVLKNPSKLSLRGGKEYGNDEREILTRENRQFMEVSQMICKPYNILLMKPGTVHRGIANRSGVDRVVFSVCYTNVKGYLSGQPKIATQKQDIE